MTTPVWKIVGMDRHTADGGVFTVHWQCNAVDGDFSAGVYSSVGLTPNPHAADFVAYDKLTEAQVIGWVKAELGADTVAATEAAVVASIADQKAPKIASGLPWSA